MNDRVSNAPPPTFLGPEEMAAYEQQFYAESNYARSNSRPTSGSEQSFNRNSGSRFWDGIRDRFTRTKSSSSINTISSSKSKASNRFSQQSQQSLVTATAPNEKENVAGCGYYPSKEEVMENYKNLVDAGFFSSHAIQGTRHQPPPSRSGARIDHPLPAPPPPARDAPPAPFAQLVAQKQRQLQHQSQVRTNPATPAMSSLFASIPYSATQPSPTGDPPKTTYPRPDPRPPISLPKKYRRPQPTAAYQMAPPPPITSPGRGTKRANADMTGGTVDREAANASTDNLAAGAGSTRKLVKKLRKSASRMSADLSLRPATSAGTGAGSVPNHPYGSSGSSTKDVDRGISSTTSVDFVPRPPISSAGRATVGSVVRSLSNSFKRDGSKTAELAPPPPAANNNNSTNNPLLATTAPNKLLKAKRSITRRVSLGRPQRSGSISSSSTPAVLLSQPPPPPPLPPAHAVPPPVPPHGPQQRGPFFGTPSSSAFPLSTRRSYEPTTQEGGGGGDPMVLDSDPSEPPAAARNPSMDAPPPGGLSVPSFHYPQRQKKQPLAAVPDPNRGGGVPGGVPEVVPGGQWGGGAGRHVKSGSFCFGPQTAALRDVMGDRGEGDGKENGGFVV